MEEDTRANEFNNSSRRQKFFETRSSGVLRPLRTPHRQESLPFSSQLLFHQYPPRQKYPATDEPDRYRGGFRFDGWLNGTQYPWMGAGCCCGEEDQLENHQRHSPFTNYFHSDHSPVTPGIWKPIHDITSYLPRFRQIASIALVPKFESVRETRVSLHPSIILTRDATKCNDEIERKKPTKTRSPRFVASLASEQRRPEDHWPHGIAKAVRIREQ